MAPLKYGLIGMGRWAREVHIPVLNQIEEAEIVALSSRSEENLRRAAEVAKGSPRLYRDYRQLIEDPEVEAVAITHNETSVGLINPLRELAAVAKEHGKLVFVDAVSSMGGTEIKVDEWGLDVCFSSSQKCSHVAHLGTRREFAIKTLGAPSWVLKTATGFPD